MKILIILAVVFVSMLTIGCVNTWELPEGCEWVCEDEWFGARCYEECNKTKMDINRSMIKDCITTLNIDEDEQELPINYLSFDAYAEQMKNAKFGEYRKVKETSQLTEITPEIRALAKELRVGDNVLETISSVEAWVIDNIEYQEDCLKNKADYWARSQEILERGYGCCHHTTILAMSLLRANGIYAGYLYEEMGYYDHAQPVALLPDGEDTYIFILFGEPFTYFDGTLNSTNYIKVF